MKTRTFYTTSIPVRHSSFAENDIFEVPVPKKAGYKMGTVIRQTFGLVIYWEKINGH